MEQKINIDPFVNAEGQLTKLPQRQKVRHALLTYLAGKFEPDRIYNEREINAICEAWHTFGDYFLLRRELVEHGLSCRKRDGSEYWKAPMLTPEEDIQTKPEGSLTETIP